MIKEKFFHYVMNCDLERAFRTRIKEGNWELDSNIIQIFFYKRNNFNSQRELGGNSLIL